MSASGTDGALALMRAGRLAEAEAVARAEVERAPDDAQALHLLGFILATTGRAAEGLALIDRSVERAPRNPGFLGNRAQVLMHAGRLEEARRDLQRAVQLEPRFAEAWLNLAHVLRRQGRAGEALAALDRVLALDPQNAPAHYHAGLLRLERGEHAAAEAAFARVVDREPRNALAHNNRGIALRALGREAEALASFERAVACDPGHAEALNNLALAYHEARRHDEALRLFARAVDLRPGFAQALLNWGNTLRDLGEYAAARQRFDQALAANPDLPEALASSASLALETGRLEEARALYSRSLALRPGFADAEYGLAQIALREQRFAAGWAGYERRFDTHPPLAAARSLGLPRLTSADLGGAPRVALWREQGIGDQILFSTLLPELARRGAGGVVEVDERLANLYRRSVPGFGYATPQDAARAFASCEFQLPMGSLPGLLRPDLESFAHQPAALLAAEPARVEEMRRRLGTGPWIAISWRSVQRGSRRELGARKSIPLENFALLAQRTGARLLDLQYGDVEEERRQFEERHPGMLARIDGLDVFSDLEGLAAALVACGRLVTCSNATAHLAGALGVPTVLAYLRGWAPFAYWVPRADGRSLWYPSVEILTDPGWSDWEAVFEALARRGM